MLVGLPFFAGCGSDRPTRGNGTVEVVATTTVLADLVRNAGGRRVRVRALVPKVGNPHEWRPAAGTRAALRRADLLVTAGGDVDPWARELDAARTLELLPRLDPLGDDGHWWHDPVRVQRAVKEIRNELARIDVDGAGYYEAASAVYLARLRKLDRETELCLDVAGARGARLLAQHAGFRYFGDRYGIRILGAGQGRAAVGRRLWADSLAPRGALADSYLGAFAVNVGEIVAAVSGRERTCRPRV